MARLAILGHKTRGKEVIEILEMLGGENPYAISTTVEGVLYTISIYDNRIVFCSPTDKFVIFTLEEFLEKFPYKVGDKVRVPEYESEVRISEMYWDGSEVQYEVITDEIEWYSAKELNEFNEPYKEETMEERKYADLRIDVDQDDKLATEATIDGDKITPPENYLIGKITKVDNGMLVEFVRKQSQYPKTYVECAKSLECFGAAHIDGYKCELLEKLKELLICRDAYWKIAGEQMGLGKSWEPDFGNDLLKYYISFHNNKIDKGVINYSNKILAFPTAEMRDAFYENFKELINETKELL